MRISDITTAMMSLKALVILVGLRSLLSRCSYLITLGVSVDDLNAACKRFDDMNVKWKKRLTDGRMKTVAFILDPDNYWIEVIQNDALGHRSEL